MGKNWRLPDTFVLVQQLACFSETCVFGQTFVAWFSRDEACLPLAKVTYPRNRSLVGNCETRKRALAANTAPQNVFGRRTPPSYEARKPQLPTQAMVSGKGLFPKTWFPAPVEVLGKGFFPSDETPSRKPQFVTPAKVCFPLAKLHFPRNLRLVGNCETNFQGFVIVV